MEMFQGKEKFSLRSSRGAFLVAKKKMSSLEKVPHHPTRECRRFKRRVKGTRKKKRWKGFSQLTRRATVDADG